MSCDKYEPTKPVYPVIRLHELPSHFLTSLFERLIYSPKVTPVTHLVSSEFHAGTPVDYAPFGTNKSAKGVDQYL